MSYELAFNQSALKEWAKLNPALKEQFKKKLAERLENPHVPSSKLFTRFTRYQARLGNASQPSSAWRSTLTIERDQRKRTILETELGSELND